MHIELTEMLRCPATHAADVLVLSTGEMSGRLVRSGIVGCPVCHREYPIIDGRVEFGPPDPDPAAGTVPVPPAGDASVLQALLDLGGPGGFVVLVGDATRHAALLAAQMAGVHFVGVNPPAGATEASYLSLLSAPISIPLRSAMARGVVVAAGAARSPWLAEAERILLPGRRFVGEQGAPAPPLGIRLLAAGNGWWVGEKAS